MIKDIKFNCDLNAVFCIYKITFPNNKIYIGQTTRLISLRIKEHVRNSKNGKYPLYYAIRKYKSFTVDVCEICDSIYSLNNKETFYINFYNSLIDDNGYNCDTGGENKICSEQTKLKISKSNIGKKMSNETKKKYSIAKLGVKTGPMSDETKKKISKANKGRKVSKDKRLNMSIAHIGKPSGKKGFKLSEDQKENISKAKKGVKRGKYIIHCKNRSNKGIKLSEEHKKKLSEAKKGKKLSEEHKKNISIAKNNK